MNVKELKEILKDVDDNRIVILSRDEEGNGYRELYQIDDASTYKDGEIGIEKLTEEDKKSGYTEDDVLYDGKPALVFW